MRAIQAMIFLVFIILAIKSNAYEKDHGRTQPPIVQKIVTENQFVMNQEHKSDRTDGKNKTTPTKRKYKFPSMMIKDDMYHCEMNGDYNCTPLLGNLVVNRWTIVRDRYGRQCKYSSPEITYYELKEYLHFNDNDVVHIKDPKPGEPQAVIQTEWLTCNITFLDKIYDGQNASVKVKAVLIDNVVTANSKREEEYHKNKGILRTILDWFNIVHE